MDIKFYDTKGRGKKLFKPIDPKNIRFYVCGPTVYDRAHIGNARPAVVFDILFRFFRHMYGKKNVTYVRNFTDIDDKINQKSIELGKPIKVITDETIAWYENDMAALNVLKPTKSPRATDFVQAMVKHIEILISKGNAYTDSKGHVLFSVKSFPEYGSLSKRRLDEMEAGARVEIAENKKDPMDFVLWKPSSEEVPGWESPWGRGRPGWHIECSAMISELIGLEFDIHGGGIDLAFPHHENELAQSACVYPGSGFANFWMHNGFLQIEGEKMSKSLGNYFTVKDLTNSGLSGDIIRMMLLSTHYRQPLDWTSKKVSEVSNIIKRWKEISVRIEPEKLPSENVLKALADDLNTPLVISELHKLVSQNNLPLFLASARFLGLLVENSDTNSVKMKLSSNAILKIEQAIDKRLELKREKDFEKADDIRQKMNAAGIAIKDTSNGTEWKIEEDISLDKLKDLI